MTAPAAAARSCPYGKTRGYGIWPVIALMVPISSPGNRSSEWCRVQYPDRGLYPHNLARHHPVPLRAAPDKRKSHAEIRGQLTDLMLLQISKPDNGGASSDARA